MNEKPLMYLAFQGVEPQPDVKPDRLPRWAVIGVGGCGCITADDWALDETGLRGDGHYAFVDTDWEALSRQESLFSKATANADNQCYRLGPEGLETGQGYGAGSRSESGAAYAQAAMPELHASFSGADVVFVLAGLGGGTGSGAAPVIARAARASGARVVALATMPFDFEGARRQATAHRALANLRVSASEVAVLNLQDLMHDGYAEVEQSVAFKLVSDVMLAHAQKVLTGLIDAREVTLSLPIHSEPGNGT